MNSFGLKSGAIVLAVAVLAQVYPSEGQTCDPTRKRKLELVLATGAVVNSCSGSGEAELSASDLMDRPIAAQYMDADPDTKYALLKTTPYYNSKASSLEWLLSNINGADLKNGVNLRKTTEVYKYRIVDLSEGIDPHLCRFTLYAIKRNAGEVKAPKNPDEFLLIEYQTKPPFNTDEPIATQLVIFTPM